MFKQWTANPWGPLPNLSFRFHFVYEIQKLIFRVWYTKFLLFFCHFSPTLAQYHQHCTCSSPKQFWLDSDLMPLAEWTFFCSVLFVSQGPLWQWDNTFTAFPAVSPWPCCPVKRCSHAAPKPCLHGASLVCPPASHSDLSWDAQPILPQPSGPSSQFSTPYKGYFPSNFPRSVLFHFQVCKTHKYMPVLPVAFHLLERFNCAFS